MPVGFTARVLVYYATQDLIPLYSAYALLFADAGLATAQISLLFVVWSGTALVLEVPSGAWADLADRRLLLVIAAGIYAAAFVSWLLFPCFAGFAAGFALWGLSGSMMSGTFEALLYDELSLLGAAGSYPRLIGWAHAAAMSANLAAAGLAVPLLAVGGYRLVGWVSVAMVGIHLVLAASLPVSAHARRPHPGDDALQVAERVVVRYARMLGSGVHEAGTSPLVRRVVVIAALLVGLAAYDEYFPLVARAHDVTLSVIPVLLAIQVAGQGVGTALVGVTARLPSRTLGGLTALGAGCVSVGAMIHPYPGFVAIGVGYGLLANAMLVAESRLQEVIVGPARATVTSVHGLASELVTLCIYGAFGLSAGWFEVTTLVALLGIPVLVVSLGVARWLPERDIRRPPRTNGSDAARGFDR